MNKGNLEKLKAWMSANRHSQQELADRMGVSQAYINQLLNGLSNFGKKTALAWSDEFGFNPKWLLYDEEPMMMYGEEDVSYTSENLYPTSEVESLSRKMKIAPLIPIDITREQNVRVWDFVTRHKDMYDTIPDQLMPNFDLIHKIRSNVLQPSIEKGDVLFLQHLELITDSIVNGHIYFLDTKKNGIVIKKVFINEGKLECYSLSAKVPVKTFSIDDIYDIFSVVAVLKYSISNEVADNKDAMLDKMIDTNKEMMSASKEVISQNGALIGEVSAQRRMIENLISN